MITRKIYMASLVRKLSLAALIGLATLTVFLVVYSPQNPLPENDYNTLIGIPFKFIHAPVCNKTNKFLILVHTSPGNIERRNILRQTWIDMNKTGIDTFFLTGKPEKVSDRQKLQEEIFKYQNFIHGDFLDTYRNLTYKHVMGLKYIFYHCPNIEFIIKVDDDVFVNTHVLKTFFDMYKQNFVYDNKIMCTKRVGHSVLRDGKWAVDENEYPSSTYPPHCLGFAVIYPKKTIEQLYQVAQRLKYFWIDDVHVTGTVAQEAGVTQFDISGLSMDPSELSLIVTDKFKTEIRPVLFGPPEISADHIKKLHQFISDHGRKSSMTDYIT